jgi:dipeptidyl aminopeptidase/acylaminoacyl peptidase
VLYSGTATSTKLLLLIADATITGWTKYGGTNSGWAGQSTNPTKTLRAGKLSGALMLIVGELDTNVDPASTIQVVNALNEAGKDYDLVFIPRSRTRRRVK